MLIRSACAGRTAARFMGTAVLLLLTITAGRADVVFLDFLAPTGNQFNYTAADRQAIADLVAADYAPFGHTVTLTQPLSGDFSRVQINATTTFGGGALSGGIAQGLDFRDTNKNDQARVNIDGLLGGAGQPALNTPNAVALTATVAAHEMGHLLGLRHADGCGCIGAGLPGRTTLTRTDYHPDYPTNFPAAAIESFTSIMASPASLGQTLNEATQNTFFNERSAIKLRFNEAGSVVNEQGAAHGTIATAQPVSLAALTVPNTLPQFIPGTATATVNFGKTFDVSAVAVLGGLNVAGQSDLYSFTAQQGDLFNFEVMSNILAPGGIFRYGNRIDPMISILDGLGNAIPYYNGVATNDDEFESRDSTLIDLIMPTTGTFFIRVNAFESSPANPVDTGNYELFFYKFSATSVVSSAAPEPGTVGLLLVGMLSAGAALRRRNPAR